MKLFSNRTEHMVRHGQITIRRGINSYEYQLPAQYSKIYNNQTVGVRHFDFKPNPDYSIIYLYEKETDKPVCSVTQKVEIHGALANQTEKDWKDLNKNAGRMKGIAVQTTEWRDGVRAKAKHTYSLRNYNDIHERVNKRNTSKDFIEVIRKSPELQSDVLEYGGFTINEVHSFPVIDETLGTLNPKKEKEKRHPFHKGDGTMEILTIDINN